MTLMSRDQCWQTFGCTEPREVSWTVGSGLGAPLRGNLAAQLDPEPHRWVGFCEFLATRVPATWGSVDVAPARRDPGRRSRHILVNPTRQLNANSNMPFHGQVPPGNRSCSPMDQRRRRPAPARACDRPARTATRRLGHRAAIATRCRHRLRAATHHRQPTTTADPLDPSTTTAPLVADQPEEQERRQATIPGLPRHQADPIQVSIPPSGRRSSVNIR